MRLGMAIVFITHDLGVVAQMARRVVVMYAGQVVESGPVEEIFERPRMPYTAGLIASIPRLGGAGRGARLRTIPGTVPSAAQPFPQLPPALSALILDVVMRLIIEGNTSNVFSK